MTDPLVLRRDAEALAAPYPALLAEARHLAQTVLVGEHGRRRAGMGDAFWQYRPATAVDEARQIDWRRSARADVTFVQDKEWQIAQSVLLWVDQARSMDFASVKEGETKALRARRLALATAVLLNRGGERVGLPGLPPRRGEGQMARIAALLSEDGTSDYGAPTTRGLLPHSRALFLGDFLGGFAGIEAAVTEAADRDVTGALVQVLDPAEEAFPFDGRTIFESIGGTLSHETLKAGDLRKRYLDRLADRREALSALTRACGWQFHIHRTDQSASAALLWIYGALERRR